LVGDFAYDPNPSAGTGGSNGGKTPDEQGDIVVIPNTGLITTEQGRKAMFTMALKRPPMATVAITLTSSNELEGKVTPNSVTFSTENFASPQMIQVTGQDDAVPDGAQKYVIRTSAAASDDPTYFGLDPLDPEITNVDDDTAGFLVTPTSGLVTNESGLEAYFSIVLNHAPTANVTIGLTSDNLAEGTVSPEALIFTPDNWMAPQMVTVTGVDDGQVDPGDVVDPNDPTSMPGVPYHIVTAEAVSDDPEYNTLNPEDVTVKNQDNDSAGVMLTPPDGLLTFENGAMTTFGIALTSPPKGTVTIGLESDHPEEGFPSPTVVTFTPDNWMAPQVITVTGVDDTKQDGPQPYLIKTGAAESDDPAYQGFDGPDASVTNVDDDSASIALSPIPTGGLITGEDGAAATFGIKLNTKPAGDVIFDVVSTRMDEGQPSPMQLTFTELNWAAEQIVTVTGQDDAIADGMQVYTVHVRPNDATADGAYKALNELDVPCANTDNDSPQIVVMPTGTMLTTKEDGSAATFTVVLQSQPTAEVTVPLTSSDTTEGTVSPSKLVFTRENYAAPQTVTVKGVDDKMADGNQPYRINTEPAVSGDGMYNGMNAPNVEVSNLDDDSPGIIVAPNPATNQLLTRENGAMATFTVVLQSQPKGDVTIGLTSTDVGEGTVSPAGLKFTKDNWNAPQTVTVKGVDDPDADGDQTFRIAIAPSVSAADPQYNGIDPLDMVVKNADDDSPGVILEPAPPTLLVTSEKGGMATFTIKLKSRPGADVSLALSSSRTAEGTVSPDMVTFTAANWAAPQTVTIKGVNDDRADGSQIYRILIGATASDDPKYKGIDPPDQTVSNTDDDSPGITLTPAMGPLTTSEKGVSATFTIALNSQPTADVSMALRSTRTGEGTVTPPTITFTPVNWNAPKTITIMGINDDVADGPQPYTIVIDPATSGDLKYAGLDAADMAVSNIDDDSAGITVTAAPGLTTTEKGGTATFTVALNSQPKGDVVIPLKSSDTSEGTISPSSLTFTMLNWGAAQKVTVTGVNDNGADGPQPYFVEVQAAMSPGDSAYNLMDAPDVAISNIDDDSPGFLVTDPVGTVSEKGTSTTFTVVLTSQPTASVSIPVRSSATLEGTVSPAMLTFTMDDWSSPKTVTVTGVDDDVADGPQPFTVFLDTATSTDVKYRIDPRDVTVTNIDDDSANIEVTQVSGITHESGDSFTFRISITSKPTADVTIPLSSSDTTEGTVSPASITFTTVNWMSSQQVTVTGVNDDMADGNQGYTAVIGAAMSTDGEYAGINPRDVTMTNMDDDSPGIVVSPVSGSTRENGTTFTFNVSLNSQPTGTVTIPIESSDPTEGSVTPTSLMFTVDNWKSAQPVTVHGENDQVADGNVPYTVKVLPAKSTDRIYDTMDGDDVSLTNVDDEMADIVVSKISNNTKESGQTATFTVVLTSMPTGTVSIPVHSDNTDEATIVETSIVFTTDDWNVTRTITVHPVNDDIEDLDQTVHIVLENPTSSDTKYAAINPADVTVINEDDDAAGVNVSPSLLNVIELGSGTSFNIKLNSQPTADVVIPLSVSDASEVKLQVMSVTITPGGWKTGTSVTVLPMDDKQADGLQTTKVITGVITSDDDNYNGTNPADVDVKTADNDTASIVVGQPSSSTTSEDPSVPTVKIHISLTSAPTSAVTIPIVSTNTDEGAVVSPASGSVVLDADNYEDGVDVIIQGVPDGMVDGDKMFSIEIGPSVSQDPLYDDEAMTSFDFTNVDIDTP
jgi:hypothetical protein